MNRKKWTDDKLFFRLLNNKSDKTYWDNIRELHLRPNKVVFEKCSALIFSDIPKERIIGIDILAQFGTPSRPFYNETIKLFFDLLEKETHPNALTSLIFAIGHNNDHLNEKQMNKLISFKDNKNPCVREALVHSLLGLDDKEVINALILLSNDKVSSIRDWATFGLSAQTDTDNEYIRNALWNRTNDKNQDVRLEAIYGLAKRHDLNIKEVINRELKNGEYGTLLFEAIEVLDAVEFLPLLKNSQISAKNDAEISPEWLRDLTKLIDKLEKGQKK